VSEGYTLGIRHMQPQDEGFAAMAAESETAFRGAVDVHRYCTLAGALWHYDAEEVFILQTADSKLRSFESEREPQPTSLLMKEFLVQQGVAASDVLIKAHSRSTCENALERQLLLESHNLQRITLATDASHMP
jgi:uncharacterized SAM-binding protein YcdF (DUF218 family)